MSVCVSQAVKAFVTPALPFSHGSRCLPLASFKISLSLSSGTLKMVYLSVKILKSMCFPSGFPGLVSYNFGTFSATITWNIPSPSGIPAASVLCFPMLSIDSYALSRSMLWERSPWSIFHPLVLLLVVCSWASIDAAIPWATSWVAHWRKLVFPLLPGINCK